MIKNNGAVEFQEILDFWFDAETQPYWFIKSEAFDRVLKERFFNTLIAARQGECEAWRKSIYGRLAEVIVLDQFSRNIFRGTPNAFVQDAMALALAQEAVKQPDFDLLSTTEKKFLIMPYMHSESQLIHQQAIPLFAALNDDDTMDFELRHKAIIDRFGRYPHRNSILNRTSSEEELLFLQQPGSAF